MNHFDRIDHIDLRKSAGESDDWQRLEPNMDVIEHLQLIIDVLNDELEDNHMFDKRIFFLPEDIHYYFHTLIQNIGFIKQKIENGKHNESN